MNSDGISSMILSVVFSTRVSFRFSPSAQLEFSARRFQGGSGCVPASRPMSDGQNLSEPLVRRGQAHARVAVVGAGAVGGYFGGMLARAGGAVVLIGRAPVVAAIQRQGLFLDTLTFSETVSVEASSDLSAVGGAEVVLFCVKTTDTVATARAIAPFLSPATTVVSLQNGAENAALIQSITGRLTIPAVVYLAAAMVSPGVVKHSGRGDLIIGPDGLRVQAVAGLFQRAGIGCVVSARIDDAVWAKLICNSALNAISALTQKTYGQIGDDPFAWEIVEQVVEESLAVAHGTGVTPADMDDRPSALAAVRRLTRQIAGAYSSTAQDLRRGRRTEIDALNGFIAHRGRELGVPTPVNHTLWALVRAAEPNSAA